jgi:hypothetical protein
MPVQPGIRAGRWDERGNVNGIVKAKLDGSVLALVY